MPIRITQSLGAIAVFAASLALTSGVAMAKSEIQKQCSEKYKAAKTANSLNGQTYNQFYKQCAAEAKAAPVAPSAAAPAVAPAPMPVAPPATTTAAAPVAPAKPPMAAPPTMSKAAPVAPAPTATVGSAVFPTAISPSLTTEKPGKARMQTCLAQYNANKGTNGNGGLKWIEKGGGYYSECNKRLKS